MFQGYFYDFKKSYKNIYSYSFPFFPKTCVFFFSWNFKKTIETDTWKVSAFGFIDIHFCFHFFGFYSLFFLLITLDIYFF